MDQKQLHQDQAVASSRPARKRTLPGQKRLPKFKRRPRAFGQFVPTDRDMAILNALDDFRHLTSRHLQLLVNRDRSRKGIDRMIARRLQGLFHHKFISRTAPESRIRFEGGSKPFVYSLDRPGAEAICDWLKQIGIEERPERFRQKLAVNFEDLRWRLDQRYRTIGKLLHELGISDLRVALELATSSGHSFENWNQDRDLGGEYYSDAGKKKSKTIRPDAYFTLNGQSYFLEYDRATEESEYILKKYRAYWLWFQEPLFQEAFPNSRTSRVLFVTTTSARRDKMMALLKEMRRPTPQAKFGGRSMYLFALDTDYNVETPGSILSPLFRVVTDKTKRVSLI